MIGKRTIIALIPARIGSKRLPKKNISRFCGKPLINWTISAAKSSKYIDRVIVSTDSEEIAEIAKAAGAEVPFERPSELATDRSSTNDVLLHAIKTLELNASDLICLLQPTSPLRNSQHIDCALSQHFEKSASGTISVCKCEHPPEWTTTLPNNKSLENFAKSRLKLGRSQDHPDHYRLNGAIYIFDIGSLKKNKGIFYGNNVFAFVMDKVTSVDIDDEFDFSFAESLVMNNQLLFSGRSNREHH